MKKILYLVSTLQRSGPTNQLFNLIKHLDRNKFEPHLITLSPESSDSRWEDYVNLDVKLYSLNLSRIKGALFAKNRVKALIDTIKPDLIHTQGIRADTLVSSCKLVPSQVITIHNFAPEDYSMKFGRLKAIFMTHQHFKTMRKQVHLIACSKTIQRKLHSVGIESTAIQNGIEIRLGNKKNVSLLNQLAQPVFISVGGLIPRKNMQLIINAFSRLPREKCGSLIILGDGILMNELKDLSDDNVYLLGNVNNVNDYLAGADFFVSSSLSEGLPFSVLEALAAGLPVILSDIESHQEIACESAVACELFPLSGSFEVLEKIMSTATNRFSDKSVNEAKRIANDVFSAEIMSKNYQNYYSQLIK